LLAQGVAAWEAACAGAYLHGRAAFRAGPSLVVEDLLSVLAETLTEPDLSARPQLGATHE
jgi:ADP-dependent NAD(P)H-hydrate dehydratase / NAD(P)H-hydrate epimerase